jgi:two-component system, cell cycle sensor histidine kinase and response regulator CckA
VPSPVPGPSRATEVARLELARLAPDAHLDRVFGRACELAAEALAVERVGVWLFIDDRSALRCANLFEQSKGEHSSGSVLRVADFPTYFSSLTLRKAVPAEVAATEPWTAELAAAYLTPLGISSMLDAGIFVDGNLVGVVCHEHVGPLREWTTEARDFAGSVADLLALKIKSAEMHELRAAFLTQRERVVNLEKTAALEQLAAGVAHDFRTLLVVFHGHGELLSLRDDLPPDVRAQGKAILTAAERGAALAEQLMEFARPVEKPPVVLAPEEVLAEFLPVLRSAVGSRHDLRYSCPAELGRVLIDRTQLTRVLLNLVVNARDAMPEGGPIEVRALPVKLTGHPSYTGRFVLIEVSDCGAGMDEATRRRIFEPFFTTKRKGTGLGLAIVHRVVERAGGVIRVESTVGQGTTFRVFLPRIGASRSGTAEYPLPPGFVNEGEET